ncbi:MAG: diaminopimelate decarboxylase, partial [Helicobacter sp.]|nr:diaminopimelate decarboxylase [Helicobacter sp.]
MSELAKRFGTPLYLYDFSHITRQYSALKDEFAARKSLIAYALKANSNLSIVAHLARLGAGADCVSLGEVKRALLAGIAPYKIIFSGVGKQEYEIREALK